MEHDLTVHRRRSTRLKDYDYSSNGLYFITVCTQGREQIFGEVIVGADLVSAQMKLNLAGEMIENIWSKTIERFPSASSEKFILMPNHAHFIIGIARKENNKADTRSAPTVANVVQAFKSETTVEYIKGVKSGVFPSFNKRIWQRSYHDHIIRDEADYRIKWEYINTNPTRWAEDEYYTT